MFDEYFHEICIDLHREARLGITDFYANINYLNKSVEKYDELLDDFTGISKVELLDKSEDIYVNAVRTLYIINILLNNKKENFSLLKGKPIQLEQKIIKELEFFKKEALASTPESIVNNYHRE
ncbi:hypothetical protein CJF42_24535 [Pseudoalteromonas sp. NBT06-2]|uniref:hypothetical protein n=1 Tax=Pseudoalteromonas sp. NBT06-2 TaxID=2025950 RepID=UPI000BA7A57B|nr:hypothetical protein [Pseudoalteromonas sp. NBT06-2]PAJ71830.1 hypothetical protein CJF42_24535 [Pseudoalteromonas sp. NBT06-2]